MVRIGVDLGGTNMAAGLVNEKKEIIAADSVPTRKCGTPEQIAEDMKELVLMLLSKNGLKREDVELVGVGIPGSVTPDGVVEDANNIGFVNVPFKKMMETLLKMPVSAVNDARAAAYGEYFAGAGKGAEVFQMLTIGTGIGGATIINGKVIEGCNGGAGEIGHMVLVRDGKQCNCGRKGCFEVYASASALKERMEELASSKPTKLLEFVGGDAKKLNGKTLFKGLEAGDALSSEIFNEFTDYLAAGITDIINMLQPDVLCIGGGMSAQGEKLLAPVREKVYSMVYTKHSKVQTKILAAVLGNDAGIIGAAYSKI
ncbi:MAG: ROK family protein [Lachnospiraceae bacterium]|nr:ROK family protein [Lachnospiraceae bacterium]